MKSISGRKWVLLATAASTLALAACDSIKDRKFKSSIPPPAKNYVLRGEVSGLTTRPVVLHYTGPAAADAKNVTVSANGPFSFSAVPGGSYTVTVATPPVGKICSITNASGTISADVTDLNVTCEPDPDAPVYNVSGTVTGLAANATGMVLQLTTSDGTETVPVPAAGTSFAFTSELLTDFTYAVTVSTKPQQPGAFGGPPVDNNCALVNGSGTIVDHDIADVSVVCGFKIGGSVSYNGPPTPIGAGLTLALNSSGAQVDSIAFNPAGATFQFPLYQSSTASASFSVSVATHPAGQRCVLRGAGSVSLTTPADVSDVAVTCAALPILGNQLTGTYKSTGRDFMTFFADGTFLYGTHSSTSGATGVEHGFYSFNCCGPGSLFFSVTTDTNGASGLSNVATDFGFVFASGTVKNAGPPATISFTSSVPYTLTAANSAAGQFTGAWGSTDHLRAFAYDVANGTAFHYGVNGAANLQDQCLTLGAAVIAGADGSFTPSLAAGSCSIPGGLAPVNVDPSNGFAAFPGTPGAFGALTVDYKVTAGSPDSLSLQPTFFGGPFGAPVVFERSVVN